MSGLTKNPLASLAALGLAGIAPSNTGGLNPTGKSWFTLIFFENTNRNVLANQHIGALNTTSNLKINQMQFH